MLGQNHQAIYFRSPVWLCISPRAVRVVDDGGGLLAGASANKQVSAPAEARQHLSENLFCLPPAHRFEISNVTH